METKPRILVTGGAGYIGSILVPRLLALGFSVIVLDNLMYRQVTLLNCFQSPNFQFIKGDVADGDLIQRLLSQVDIVIPLAAIVGAQGCALNPSIAKLVNYDSVQLLLSLISPHHKILFPNTNSGYGVGQKGAFCTEKSPLNPISLYGKLKAEIEKAVLASGQAVVFRFATVFGVSPRMRLDLLVNDFTYRACHDKSIVLFEEHFKRNYLHVDDAANAFIFGLNNFEKMRGEAYNVGLSSANLSKRELCDKIKQYVPDLYVHSAEVGKDPDQRDYIVSNEKLESLGWKSTKTIDEGIQELISAYKIIRLNTYTNF
jgi:nucleoside-diphosphate-sugar epimerase